MTSEEIQELRVAHKSSKDKSDAYRINTILLLGTGCLLGGYGCALLDDETLRNYLKKYRDGWS